MSAPVLHVQAGPNGSGKSIFVQTVLQPVTHIPFIELIESARNRDFVRARYKVAS